MPGRSKKHKNWSPENMKNAIEAVRKQEMGYLKASRTYNVPKSTLEDYVKHGSSPAPPGRKPTLPLELEESLVNYCLEMDRRFFGLTTVDIRRLAYQLALQNGISHTFSEEKGLAGKKWLKGFLSRHSNLTLRTPQGLSKARIKGFTKENVDRFFDLLEPALEKIKFNPLRTYNVDETGITTVQSKHPRVISLKGKKQVCALTAAERGALVTIVFCMNAAGGFVPPLFVFPRKNMKQELLDGAPPGSIASCHPSGWIQQHIFTQWFRHFIAHVKPTEEDPVLLILDGHYSHTRNLDLIETARTHHVTIVCIPPHTSHKLQPLDLTFMSPFKTYYSQAIQSWLKTNPGRNITSFQICSLMCQAYLKCSNAEISVNGFRNAGIYPYNRDIFSDVDFVTERQRERTPPQQEKEHAREKTPENIEQREPIEKTPENKRRKNFNGKTSEAEKNAENFVNLVKPEDIIPIPSCSGMQNSGQGNRKGRRGASYVITSTPYKDDLETSLKEKERKESLKTKKSVKRDLSQRETKSKGKATIKKPKTAQKKHILVEDSSSDSDDEPVFDDDSDMDASDADVECMFCNGLFSEDVRGEQWIRCRKCCRWVHEDCANSDKKKEYICDICLG